jgi:hypothetical protein
LNLGGFQATPEVGEYDLHIIEVAPEGGAVVPNLGEIALRAVASTRARRGGRRGATTLEHLTFFVLILIQIVQSIHIRIGMYVH